MFWRRKSDQSKANRLHDEAEPNELSLEMSDENELLDDEERDESEDEELDDEDLEDATYEDEPVGEDEDEAARRAAELRAEVEREAAEFGLATASPTMLYGPNGDQVAAFLDRLSSLSDEELEQHFDAWDGVPRPERRVAAIAAQEAEQAADLAFETESARRAVAAWVVQAIGDADDPSGDAERFYAEMGRAVGEAAVALVLKPELDEADFEVLGGSWAAEVADRPAPEIAEPETEAAERPIEDEELGPNTALVARLLDLLEALDTDQILALAAAWRRQPQRALRDAHRDVQGAVKEDEAWREQVRLAQDRVRSWVNRESQPTDGTGARPRPTRPLRPEAAPPAADAVAALVLADLLEPENAELLYDPWYSVVGEPELPLDEEDEGDEEADDDEDERDDEDEE